MLKKSQKLRFAVLATDVVLFTIFNTTLHVLLMKVYRPPHFTGHWGVPGGLINPKETAEQSAKRHLKQKVGVKNVYLEQLYTFSRVNRDPRGRVVSVAYMALVPRQKTQIKSGGEVRWYSIKKLPTLAYDHKQIISYTLERLRAKLGYTNIAMSILPSKFTLGDLQKTYEIILRHRLDKRNFRKKFLSLNLIKPTGKKVKGRAYRPAELYGFSSKKQKVVEIL